MAWRATASLLVAAAAFFGYYTARLIYINIAVAGVAEHRRSGMYVGFVAFPAAVAVFGWLAGLCWRKGKRG